MLTARLIPIAGGFVITNDWCISCVNIVRTMNIIHDGVL